MPSRSRVVLLVAAVALVAIATTVGWWRARPEPVPFEQLPPVTGALRQVGPHETRVIVGDEDLGSLFRDPATGDLSGNPLLYLPGKGRRIMGRRVELTRDPQVPLQVAGFVERMLVRGGAMSCVVVEEPR